MVADKCVTEHSAYIYDRGGETRFGQSRLVDIARVKWERDRDGISEAEIVLTGRSCGAQRDFIKTVSSKRHELVIFRGQERVWEGPISRIGDSGDKITIAAKDVCWYLYGTALSRVWDNTTKGDGASTVTERLERIIDWEFTHDRTVRTLGGSTLVRKGWENASPPVNLLDHLVVHHFPNEAETSARTNISEMTIGEHLENYARNGGIDFTAIGRNIHIWDTSRSIGRTRQMTEADFFGRIIVTEYGADHTQIAYVAGNDGVYGEAANPDNIDFYGPWESVYTAYNEEGSEDPTQGELNSQAARNTSGRSPVPFEVRVPDNSSVRLSSTLSVMDLVPGVQVPLRATLNGRDYAQMQKIDHVTVTETAAGETVQMTLTPATRADSDEEEE